MSRRKYTALLMISLLICLCAPAAFASPEQSNGFWRGFQSDQKEPFIKIVDQSQEWSELWMRAFRQAAPPVDFEKNVVACVFLGYSADWLYSVHIDDPVRHAEAWVVSYDLIELVLELSKPFKASGQYAMKVLEKKKDAPMLLEGKKPYGGRR